MPGSRVCPACLGVLPHLEARPNSKDDAIADQHIRLKLAVGIDHSATLFRAWQGRVRVTLQQGSSRLAAGAGRVGLPASCCGAAAVGLPGSEYPRQLQRMLTATGSGRAPGALAGTGPA